MKSLFVYFLLSLIVVSTAMADGKDGEPGQTGQGGQTGQAGSVNVNFIPTNATAEYAYYLPILRDDVAQVQDLLSKGIRINAPMGGVVSHPTAFQTAIENLRPDIIKQMVTNPDTSNKPNLRQQVRTRAGGITNIYENLIIGSDLDASNELMESDIAIRSDELGVLEILLTRETDLESLTAETSRSLTALISSANRYLTYPSNVKAISLVKSRMEALKN